jgi:hypothetical protein
VGVADVMADEAGDSLRGRICSWRDSGAEGEGDEDDPGGDGDLVAGWA